MLNNSTKQAEPIFKRALHVREQVLGTDHVDLVLDLKNLAGLYITQEQYEDAAPHLKRALSYCGKSPVGQTIRVS